ncbi:L,D-transpeptidase family protein [Brachybacterium timonense]|uniref:L,D-transpeptidase family protein n=1 Tax=Brachybacterium timonense TaxID=2050896 RepID=UPI000D0B5D88|nr:L,D-transpeptidase family protein [Brachybacterium timonense]
MTHGTDAAALGGPSRPVSSRGRMRLALILVAILAVIGVVLAGSAYGLAQKYDGRALPGTTLLGEDIAGHTPEQIAEELTKRADGVKVTVTADGTDHEASLVDLGVNVDAQATAKAALSRDDSITALIASLWSGEHAVEPVMSVDSAAAAEYAKGLVADEKAAPVDASVSFDEESEEWTVTPGTDGQGVDPSELVAAVEKNAPSLKSFSVEQSISQIAPSITTEEAETVVGDISALLEQPMQISGPKDKTYEVSPERRSSWLSVGPDEAGEKLVMSVDEEAVRDWVSQRADKSAVKPKDGIEQVDESGKVVKVVAEKTDGVEITNTDAVADELIAALKGSSPLEAAFESKTVEAKVTQAKAPAQNDETPSDDDPAAGDAPAPTGEKWIDVDLTAKTVTAYVGDTPVWGPRSMVDGKSGYETVTGSYNIYLRYDKQDMTNQSRYPKGHPKHYYTKDVPWVQYFYKGYAFHGAPWRSSFGYSGSHGCINMKVSDAKWLYNWASMGTRVEVHR